MANKSAEKREREEAKRRLINRAAKSKVRTAIKKFDQAVMKGDKETAEASLKESCKLLDSAASKGVMHKNTASRKKSRLTHAYNKLA